MSRKYSFLLCMVTVMITIFIQNSLSIKADMNKDLNILLQSSNPWFEEDKNIMVQYGDFYISNGNKETLIEVGERLGTHFGLPSGEISIDDFNRPVYQTLFASTQDQMETSLRLVSIEKQQMYHLMLTLKATNTTPMEILEQRQNVVEKHLEALGLSNDGQFMIQGNLLASLSPEDSKWWEEVHHTLRLKELERYHDGGTLSISFYSPKLNSQIHSGTQTMNLQMALHQDTESKQWRLTIGAPIITMEY